jgi:sortase A
MNIGVDKSCEAGSVAETPQSKGKRTASRARRIVANLLLIVGLALLGIYVSARIHSAYTSRAAIQKFEEQKKATRAPVQEEEKWNPEQKISAPNFLTWSEKRIQGYADSLNQHLDTPLAVLRIPKIQLEVPVLEGTDDLTLNRGVGRIEGTARIGEAGNIGIAGHRDGFFRGLKDIKVGDRLQMEERDGTVTYVVDELKIVKPTNVEVLEPRSKPSLTLVTCYPFHYIGSAPERYIVHASRLDSETQKYNSTGQGS